MFRFGSDRLVLVLFGSDSSISNYLFAFLSICCHYVDVENFAAVNRGVLS